MDVLANDGPDVCVRHAVHERGAKVPCIHVLKAICGMSIGAVLWHEKFRKDSEEDIFLFNPCDPCVANRMTNDKQQTVRFHVDDSMSSHVDPK